MKRFAFVALLFALGCSTPSAPSGVGTISVNGNASVNGVFIGDQVQLSTVAYDYSGLVVTTPVTYTSSNTSVATVLSTGLITAIGAGSTTINVAAGGKSAQVPITVDGNITKTVGVTPSAFTMQVGHTLVVTAFVGTTLNNPAHNKTVVWSSADATKASVDASGTVTAKVVTATVNICAAVTDGTGIQGCAAVTVIP